MGSISPAVTALLIIVVVAAVGSVIGWARRNATFRGYEEISGNARRIARLLKGELFRDGDDLVVSGNHQKMPVVVRFSYAENTPGVNISMEAPANFTLSIVPRGMKADGRVVMHAPDQSFDARFSLASNHPTEAKMFLGGRPAFAALQRLCASGRMLVTIARGRIELSELAYPTEASSRMVVSYLPTMAELARQANKMPGATLLSVTPIRHGVSWVTRVAMAAGLVAALVGVIAASRDFDRLVDTLPQFGLPKLPSGVALAQAQRIPGVDRWRLLSNGEFDPDAAAWLRGSGTTVSAHVAADFSGKGTPTDDAFVFTDEQGNRRLVLLASGENRYDVRYPYIGVVARVKKEQIPSIEWTEKPPLEPDGDGLLIVRTKDRASGLVLFTQGRRIISGVPADYQTIHPSE